MKIELSPLAVYIARTESATAGVSPETIVERALIEYVTRNVTPVQKDEAPAEPENKTHENAIWLSRMTKAVAGLDEDDIVMPGPLADAVGWSKGDTLRARQTTFGIYLREVGLPSTKTRNGNGVRVGDIRAAASTASNDWSDVKPLGE